MTHIVYTYVSYIFIYVCVCFAGGGARDGPGRIDTCTYDIDRCIYTIDSYDHCIYTIDLCEPKNL